MSENKLNNFMSSATVELHSLALGLKKQGKSVYSLAAGEPKIQTSLFLKNSGSVELGYPPVSGVDELKKLVSIWQNNTFGSNYAINEVSVVPGAKMGIFLLLRALLKVGDTAVVISPYWVSYPQIVELCYGKILVLKTLEKNDWKISAKDVENIKIKNCKVLIINNGSNPCATLYSKTELQLILRAAQKKGLFVISDEVYGCLAYDSNKFYSIGEFKQYKYMTAVLQSCSKTFALPGIRTGFVFAPEVVIKVINSLNSQTTSGVSLLSQNMALLALKNAHSITQKVNKEMLERRDLMFEFLKKYWRIDFPKPKCALYFFLKVSDLKKNFFNDQKFCANLLKQYGVVIAPGTAFGQIGYVRLSFGSEPKTIMEGIKLMAKFCGK